MYRSSLQSRSWISIYARTILIDTRDVTIGRLSHGHLEPSMPFVSFFLSHTLFASSSLSFLGL